MKKTIQISAGVTILLLVIATITLSLRLLNYSRSLKITSVLFQPAQLWQNRIDAPISLEKISDSYIQNRLIEKFAIEYLSVVPDSSELASRSGDNSLLRMISNKAVFDQWTKNVLPTLQQMADGKQLRRIMVDRDHIKKQGDYFVVPFTTETWSSSNDLSAHPIISSGNELYLRLYFNKKLRDDNGFDAGVAMDNGMPAAAAFEFIVIEVQIR